VAGRGLHLSTSQLNLQSHVLPVRLTETTQRIPQELLTSSRRVHECKPLTAALLRKSSTGAHDGQGLTLVHLSAQLKALFVGQGVFWSRLGGI